MMHSKIIVSKICYKVNNITPDICNNLIDIVDNMLQSEQLKNELNIIFIDNNIDTTMEDDNIQLIVTSYITQQHNKSIVAKLKSFIDNNLTIINKEDYNAQMLSRRVY